MKHNKLIKADGLVKVDGLVKPDYIVLILIVTLMGVYCILVYRVGDVMSELISGQLITGKEALIALANGKEVEFICTSMENVKGVVWGDTERLKNFTIHDFFSNQWSFRLKK